MSGWLCEERERERERDLLLICVCGDTVFIHSLTKLHKFSKLGVPVLARNCDGNVAIVKHMKTGLIYGDPREFIEMMLLLLPNVISQNRSTATSSLRENMIEQGRQYVDSHFNNVLEEEQYRTLMDDIEQTILHKNT